jgi:polar amino acid transport system substrate-binding protein
MEEFMKNKLLIVALALVLVLATAACSQGSKFKYVPGKDFEYVQKKGKMTVGYTLFEPMNFRDSSGKLTGFDTELTTIICERLGVKPDFVIIDWNMKEVELAAGTIDVVWNGLTITPQRQKEMGITIPYLRNAQVVVMKSDAAYNGPASLIGKTIVFEGGSAGEKTVMAHNDLKQANIITQGKQMDCMMEVQAGTANAAVLDLTLAQALTKPGTSYENLEIKDHLTWEYYGIAFRVDSNMVEMVNKQLRELAANGTLQALADKYSLVLAEFK